MWIWPQVASCDLRLHVGLHFRCNERLRRLWHSEQKQQLHLRSYERPRKLWCAEPKQLLLAVAYGFVLGQPSRLPFNGLRASKQARRTEATSKRSNRAPTTRGQEAAARGKKKQRKEDSGLLMSRNAFRAASKVLRRSLALLKCLWKRLGPLLRGLREAPGTSRGALGSVLGSSESVSETISDGFWSSEDAT